MVHSFIRHATCDGSIANHSYTVVLTILQALAGTLNIGEGEGRGGAGGGQRGRRAILQHAVSHLEVSSNSHAKGS